MLLVPEITRKLTIMSIRDTFIVKGHDNVSARSYFRSLLTQCSRFKYENETTVKIH